MKTKYVVGQIVDFAFSKVPATAEGRRITAMRPRNMHEMRLMPKYNGEWIQEWVRTSIYSIVELNGQVLYRLDEPDGYLVSADKIKAVLS